MDSWTYCRARFVLLASLRQIRPSILLQSVLNASSWRRSSFCKCRYLQIQLGNRSNPSKTDHLRQSLWPHKCFWSSLSIVMSYRTSHQSIRLGPKDFGDKSVYTNLLGPAWGYCMRDLERYQCPTLHGHHLHEMDYQHQAILLHYHFTRHTIGPIIFQNFHDLMEFLSFLGFHLSALLMPNQRILPR